MLTFDLPGFVAKKKVLTFDLPMLTFDYLPLRSAEISVFFGRVKGQHNLVKQNMKVDQRSTLC